MSLQQILRTASKNVTPSKREQERLDVVSKRVHELIESAIESSDIRPKISVGGSYAKGTWLRGEGDIDFFLQYPPEYERVKLETEAIELAKRAVRGYKINIRFAEHPYVEAFVDTVRVNLVPCYKVDKGKWKSAADRSPFHEEYVRSRFDDEARLNARLLKSFAKSGGIYGAEVKTHGLSGYVCEVLILKFRNFQSVLEKISQISPGEIISVEPYEEDLAASFTSPLVILDPVDTTRNLGEAISVESASKFILRCRRFLRKPSLEFFSARARMERRPSTELLSRTVAVIFRNDKRSVDILWGQLQKSLRALTHTLEEVGFTVLRESASSNENDRSGFVFLLLENNLSKIKIREGPEVFRKEEVQKFVEKNRRRDRSSYFWIDPEKVRVNSLTHRDKSELDASKYLTGLFSNEKKLASIGVSKAIREEITGRSERNFRVISGRSARGMPWLRETIDSLLASERELD